MSSMDELFNGDSGKEMDIIAKMAMLSACAELKKITALALEISISPISVSANVTGNKALANRLGLEDVIKDFSKEVEPIAKKYSKIVRDKYKADFREFCRGGVSDDLADASEELYKKFFDS